MPLDAPVTTTPLPSSAVSIGVGYVVSRGVEVPLWWDAWRPFSFRSATIPKPVAYTVPLAAMMRPMSNVARVQRSYDAFARDDLDGVLADMHRDIEWHQAQGLAHGGLYRGLDAVRANVFEPLDRDWWEEFVVTPEEFIDAGRDVVVLGRYRGVARDTGKRLDVP